MSWLKRICRADHGYRKHNNPCGVATDAKLFESYKKALAVDSEAAFGGVIAFNRSVEDAGLANLICERFYEVIVAPHFNDAARTVFAAKKKIFALLRWASSNFR